MALVVAVVGALVAAVVVVVATWGSDTKEPTAKDDSADERFRTSARLIGRSPDGPAVTNAELERSEAILRERMPAFGVHGGTTSRDGDGIVITIPGRDEQKIKAIAATGRLTFRKVLLAVDPEAVPGADGGEQNDNDTGAGEKTHQAIAEARQTRQSDDLAWDDPAKQQNAVVAALKSIDCGSGKQDPLRGNDLAGRPLLACDQERSTTGQRHAYVLGPVIMDSTVISEAGTSTNPDGVGYQVNIDFTGEGQKEWSEVTAKLAQESATQPGEPAQVAFLLDTEVVSAPTVTQEISGDTRITGDFTQAEAENLADTLATKPLPIAFDIVDVTVSPS